ncbi:hypothetical protein F66182_4203 [Fusarium sp. NRRL 66182]|nr:hypothetical protein F66182_4203 [Fusarium sp. NRRL 66182]
MSDLRQACDRCHSKKLRCTKIPASLVCTRCVKAGVACIFSPPSRSLRQPGRVAFDWSSLFELDGPAIDPIPDVNPDNLTTTPPSSDNVDTALSAPATPVSELTDLMASLDRLQHGFPTSGRQHLSAQELKDLMETPSFDLGLFLEQLLQLSQRLLHIYPKVLEQLKPEHETCNLPDCVHTTHLSLPTWSRLSIDQSLIHLVLACHLRQLDLFNKIVDHGRVCTHVTSTSPQDTEPTLNIPEIRIGSFVAPKVSAASMMIAMVIELQSSLNKKAQQLHDAVSSATGLESRPAKILGLQCESLKESTSTTLADLLSFRDSLLKLGIFS